MTSSPWSQSQLPINLQQSNHHYPHHRYSSSGQGHGGGGHRPSYHHQYHLNMPGIPMNFSLPTLPPPPCPPQVGPSGNILTTPLPTVLFPLPLDPLCPPAVLPLYGNGTSESSGYTTANSTAGHSRSSSPMLPGGGGNLLTSDVTKASNGSLGTSSSSQISSSRNTSPASLSPGSGSNGSSSHSGALHHSSTLSQQHHLPGPYPSPNLVFEAPSTEITILSHFPTVPGQFVVYFHINPGVNVSFNVGDHVQIIKGPMTVPLVSTNSNPPIPLPMQVPPGHVVQQIVDESGTLRHIIVSHQPSLMPIPSYGAGSQNQPYFSPGPYPPFGPMQSGCGMHSSQGPTPPPGPMSGSYGIPSSYKDERAQRQYVKLRRKVEQKPREGQQLPNHFHQNGTYSRKDGGYNNNNNTRRNIPNGTSKMNGGEEEGSVGSTGSVTSTGTQDEEEETRLLALSEMLSAIVPPNVSDVTRQSAFIKWSIPDRWTESGENKYLEFDISDNDFRYEVFISDRSRPETHFKSIFLGTALSCRVKDLKPGTTYGISYCAMLNDVKGNTSTPAIFTTLPGEPDQPQSPRAITRNRNALTFKWTPPNDNGSKITQYLLEYDEGKGGSHFVESYRGKNKQCTVSRLQPAYSYQFRLAAINEVGPSRFSPTTTVMTAGSPPAQPLPPTLTEAGVSYLTLEWKSRPTDEKYCLQMEDPMTGHGFLAAYSGSAPHYTCVGLQRFTEYKFRVKAENGEGHSKWSEEVVQRTLPDRPNPPRKPTLKGKTRSTAFKVKWEPPEETGGVPLTAYSLEIDQGKGHFEEIYRGPETEFLVDKLSPGESYPLRVIALGPGGESDPSEPCVITTEPVCPGKCHIPRIIGKPKSNSVHLRWSSPDWDGGSPVNSFEVGCTTPDNLTQEAYRGKETSCFANGLLPGRSYLFQVRAYNRIGAGPWSDPLEVISGAGSPDPPTAPKVTPKSSHSVLVSWTEPLNNGSAVTEYKLQMAALINLPPEQTPPPSPSSVSLLSEDTSSLTQELKAEDDLNSEKSVSVVTTSTDFDTAISEESREVVSTFSQVYLGPNTSCEVKALQPASVYLFRLQASNYAGSSDWSSVTTHTMSASSPNPVTQVEGVPCSSSIVLTWMVPSCNGSPIIHYNLMVGDAVHVACSNSYTLDNLMPDTHHKIRVQAVNSVGPGPFSSILKVSTKPLPPVPPKLELVASAHFWMKLKWSLEQSQKNVEYIVQMINPFQDEFQVVYRGTVPNCKVTRLTEDTTYQFRICGINSAGQGHFSELFRFSTLKAPPPQVKGLKVTFEKDSQLHHFDWSDVNCSGSMIYQLQFAKKKDQEFKTVYRGELRKFTLKADEMERGTDFVCRVCAIRNVEDGNHLIGPYSSVSSFTNPFLAQESQGFSSKSQRSTSFTSNLSTTAQALEEKMNSISYESKVGLMAVIALVFLAFVISLITHQVVS